VTWIAVEDRDLRDLLESIEVIADRITGRPIDTGTSRCEDTLGKARMHAGHCRDRLRHLLRPPQPVQAQTEGQGARDIDPRELATILNLRAELAEWRKATMLENQDTATPDHLRQHLQDIGDEADRLRIAARGCMACKSQPTDPAPCDCAHAPCIHDRNATIATAADRLDSLIAAMSLPVPAATHLEGLRGTLPDIVAELRAALGGAS
jgi:hypothetical protein